MNRQFPALRGLAISMVVLYHCLLLSIQTAQEIGLDLNQWQYNLSLFLLQFGVFAVPTFLFISGSFFAYTAQGENPKLSYRMVWMGLKNLLRPYIFWSIVFYIVIFLIQGKTYSLLGYLKNLIVGYPYNFVPLIAFFYLISPVLVRATKRYGWVIVLAILAYQLFLINSVYPGKYGFIYPEWTRFLSPPIIRSTLAAWGIYFPFGIIYTLKSRQTLPFLIRFKWFIAGLTGILFVIGLLDAVKVLNFPMATFLAPMAFVLFLPSIQRKSIPFVQQFEKVGKKSYGLYLTNLIVIFLFLTFVKTVVPGILVYPIFLLPFTFAFTLSVLLFLMSSLERMRMRKIYPYVFG
jgi:peptidoglycan/LPS O-acetylase OafA/YrhL